MAVLRRFGMSTNQIEEARFGFILQDLNNLLNAKRGYAWFDENFGTGDTSHFTDKADITIFLGEEITRCIETYESRLEVTAVSEIESDSLTRVGFLVECRLKTSNHSIKIFTDLGARRWAVDQ